MEVKHRNKILAQEAVEPFPKIFKMVFALSCFYLLVIFAVTGSHYVVGGH